MVGDLLFLPGYACSNNGLKTAHLPLAGSAASRPAGAAAGPRSTQSTGTGAGVGAGQFNQLTVPILQLTVSAPICKIFYLVECVGKIVPTVPTGCTVVARNVPLVGAVRRLLCGIRVLGDGWETGA